MVATLFVQIEGVTGDAVEDQHKGWIVVESIGFGIERQSEQEGGAVSSGFGKSKFNAMTFGSEAGNHTTNLMTSTASGKPWPKVVIHQCKSGEDAASGLQPYIIWVLQNAYVQTYQIDGGSDDIPKESWSLVYTHISCTYYKTDPKNMKLTKGGDIGWDTGMGKLGGAILK